MGDPGDNPELELSLKPQSNKVTDPKKMSKEVFDLKLHILGAIGLTRTSVDGAKDRTPRSDRHFNTYVSYFLVGQKDHEREQPLCTTPSIRSSITQRSSRVSQGATR